MTKVLLTRSVKMENYQRVLGLLKDLRAAALHQPGYVSGETVIRGEDPIEILAIGTWLSEEYWRAWATSQERIEVENMIEPLIVGKATVAVYRMPEEEI